MTTTMGGHSMQVAMDYIILTLLLKNLLYANPIII